MRVPSTTSMIVVWIIVLLSLDASETRGFLVKCEDLRRCMRRRFKALANSFKDFFGYRLSLLKVTEFCRFFNPRTTVVSKTLVAKKWMVAWLEDTRRVMVNSQT